MKFETLNLTLSPRRELRLALLAAMETCWTFAVFALVAAFIGTRPISALAIFVTYWLALFAGRALPRLKRRWHELQLLAIGIAVLILLAAVRLELYQTLAPSDLSWLPRFVSAFLFSWHLSPEHIVGAGILFAFIRGLGYAQRPLTLWFTGFRFRAGIVILLFTSALAQIVAHLDVTPWVVIFFAVSLLAVALARIEENSDQTKLGARWGVILLGAIAVTLFLGFLLLQVLTLDAATTLLGWLSPLWVLFTLLVVVLSIPFSFVAEWLIELLRPLMSTLSQMLSQLAQIFPQQEQKPNEQIFNGAAFAQTFIPIAKILFMLAIVLGVGYLLARALNKRLTQIEDETYARESLDAREQMQRTTMTKPRKSHARARSLSAESIRRIYASLVEHARRAGLARQTAETPYEFLPRMANTWHESDDDLREITEAYVATHYAERDMSSELARVREAWERIKSKTKNARS